MPEKLSLPVGGKTKHFYKNWELITGDRVILDIIREGFQIPLLSEFQGNPEAPVLHLAEKSLIDEEIIAMLEKGAIREVPKTQLGTRRVYSSLFVREKKDGVNLRRVNAHIPYIHFKMEGLHCLTGLLRPDDFMVKIDMKDAFF